MSSWQDFAVAAPAVADAVRRHFDAHVHHTMATLRRDGAPRISGTEVVFRGADLWLSGMPRSRKLADLRADGRVAVHSGSDDPPDWTGDAKAAGRAVEVTDAAALQAFAAALPTGPPEAFELFRVELHEAALVRLGGSGDHLVVEAWHEGRGLSSAVRRRRVAGRSAAAPPVPVRPCRGSGSSWCRRPGTVPAPSGGRTR